VGGGPHTDQGREAARVGPGIPVRLGREHTYSTGMGVGVSVSVALARVGDAPKSARAPQKRKPAAGSP
jgi:hypothetical protein